MTAGLTYVPIDPAAFFVYNETTNGRVVTLGRRRHPVVTAGAGVMAPILVPVGSTIKEVVLTYVSPAGTANLALFRKPLPQQARGCARRSTPTPVPFPLPNGAGFLTKTLNVDEKVDGTASFMVLMDSMLTTQFVAGVLVGYLPPPQAFIPISPVNRVLDTRTTGGKLAANEERVIDLPHPHVRPRRRHQPHRHRHRDRRLRRRVPRRRVLPRQLQHQLVGHQPEPRQRRHHRHRPPGKVKIRGGVNPTHVVIDVQGSLI